MTPAQSQAIDQTDGAAPVEPVELVRRFLHSLAAGDVDAAVDMLGADVEYVNVSTPAIRGRHGVRRVLGAAMRMRGAGFEVYLHAVSTDGSTVLTERTDVLIWGPLRTQIWVCGRFDVSGGEIVLWRDYFDWANVVLALLRGLVAMAVPALGPRPPATD